MSQLAKAKSRREPRNCVFQSDTPGSAVGAHYWLAALPGPSASLSLLEHRGGFGVGGETPSTTAVLEEFGQECGPCACDVSSELMLTFLFPSVKK